MKVNKSEHSPKYQKVGTGAGSCGKVHSYSRGAKSYKSR